MVSEKILRKQQLPEIVGLSVPTIWRMEQKGLFPARRQISPGCVGWLQSEIDKWIAERQVTKPCLEAGQI